MIKLNTILYTNKPDFIGNAIVIGITPDSKYQIQTDYGNRPRPLTYEEIKSLFEIGPIAKHTHKHFQLENKYINEVKHADGILNEVTKSENIGSRFNDGKPKWGLVDFSALEGMVKVLEFGAKKYGPFNWQKGLKTVGIIESMLRHIFSYLKGEDTDNESGLKHVDHILCNAMFLSWMMSNKKEMDDRKEYNNEISR